LFFGSWQLAVGGWQLAVGSWQLAVGSWQFKKVSFFDQRVNKFFVFFLLRSFIPTPYPSQEGD
jgi:hypothetical protein